MFIQRRMRLLLCVALASLMIGALPLFAHSQTISHLTYGTHAQEWGDWLKLMAQRFEAKTGIRVAVEQGPSGSAYREQVVLRTGAGMPPDVTDFNPYMGSMLIREGMFQDLTPYVESSGLDLSLFPPMGIQGMMTPDNIMWGIPASILPIPVYYNADMFALAGLPDPLQLGDGWTWDAYLASARALTLRDHDGVPYQFGTIDQRFRFEQVVHQAGGMVYDRYIFPTESRFNSPEVLAGIEWRQTMYNEGLIATTGGVWNGNVALTMIDPPTIINKYKGGFDMEIALQPAGPGGAASVVNPDGFQIHADSPHKDIAWQWIHFLITDTDGLLDFAEMTGRLPAHRDALLAYAAIDRSVAKNTTALIETAFSPVAYPPYMVDDPAINAAVTSGLAEIWNGRTAPRVALEKIHEQVSALLRAQNNK